MTLYYLFSSLLTLLFIYIFFTKLPFIELYLIIRYLSVEFMLLFIFFCIILLSEKKRNQASEGKGLEMEPLKPKGLLIHAFVLLCLGLPNFPFSIYLLGVCCYVHNLIVKGVHHYCLLTIYS